MDDNANRLQIFTAPGCAPCEEIKTALAAGRLELEGTPVKREDVDLVDVSTDQGYPFLDQLDIHRVPAAYYGIRACEILVDNRTRTVTINCPESEDTEAASDREAEVEHFAG